MLIRIGRTIKDTIDFIVCTLKIWHTPSNPNLYWQRGQIHFDRSHYTQAIKDLTKVTELASHYQPAYFYRGLCYSRTRHYHGAIQDFTGIIESAIKDTTAYSSSKPSVTVEDFLLSKFDSQDVIGSVGSLVYFFRGLGFFSTEDYKEAIKDFSRRLELCPEDVLINVYRGHSYYRIHKFTEAIRDFSTYISQISMNKNAAQAFSAEVYKSRANSYYQLQQYDRAIEDYTRAIALEPGYSIAFRGRAACYEKVGNYVLAIEDYTKIIKSKGDGDDTLFSYIDRSLCYYHLQQYDNILQDFSFFKKELANLAELESLITSEKEIFDLSAKISNEESQGKTIFSLESFFALSQNTLHKANRSIPEEQETQSRYASIRSNKLLLKKWVALYFLLRIITVSESTLFLRILSFLFKLQFDQKWFKQAEFLDKLFKKQIHRKNVERVYNQFFAEASEASEVSDYQNWIERVESYGGELASVQFKMDLLQYISKEVTRKMLTMPFLLRITKGLVMSANFIFLLSFLNEILQTKYVELLQEKEAEKAQIQVEERNKLLQMFSHTLKNTFSKARAPLEQLQSQYERRHEQPPKEIDDPIKQLEKMERLTRAIDISFKGSPQDVYDDVDLNEGDKSLRQIIFDAFETALENILDKSGVYGQYAKGYFTLQQKREARQIFYREYTEHNLAGLQSFLDKYMLSLIVDFDEAADYILGDLHHSVTRFSILFDELVLNAVKYASFVERSKRFIHLSLLCEDEKDLIIFKIENSYVPLENETRTSGIGHEIVKNIVHTLGGAYDKKFESGIHTITIHVKDFWKEARRETNPVH